MLFRRAGGGRRALTAVAAAVAALVAATPPGKALEPAVPVLSLPIDCVPNRTCWVVNHMDRDPGPEARDYRCGRLTYDGHGGTDIAIRDLRTMERGVRVLAAADGTVTGVRDGMSDAGATGGADIARRECGNGALVDHGGGWTTQYCHLKRDSLRVAKGQSVRAGEVIGMVGLSGRTEFPHVEFTVRRDGRRIDPFVGLAGGRDCRPGNRPLWSPAALAALEYAPPYPYHLGFAAAAPEADKVRAGLYAAKALPREAPALVFWADVFGVGRDDEVTMRIVGPDGEDLVSHTRRLEKDQARRFLFVGRKRVGANWKAGDYAGEIVMVRPSVIGPPRTVTSRLQMTVR